MLTRKLGFRRIELKRLYSTLSVDKEELGGIYPAICTPFKRLKSEAVSYKGLERNLIKWAETNFSGWILMELN